MKFPVTPAPPPLAEEQLVALVEVQLILDVAPYAIDEGFAVTATVGAGGGGGGAGEPAAPTATVTLPELLPPAPVQVTVYVVFAVSAGVLKLPLAPVPPPPVDEQLVALVDVQLMFEVLLFVIEEGFAVTVTFGDDAELDEGEAAGGVAPGRGRGV